jgi:predicted methyltransferase
MVFHFPGVNYFEETLMKQYLNSFLALGLLLVSQFVLADAESERLSSVLAAQPEETQARYPYRHPQETLEFLGIEPGMTVVEALPGGGWYTKILLPYLGTDGRLIGADYAREMYPMFGFFSEEQLKEKDTWLKDFTADAKEWSGEDGARVFAFVFGTMPDDLKGKADAVVFIRALHNLARFESDGGFLTAALQNAFDALKPGGIAGVVQHQARDDMTDDWASGKNGYLKRDYLIAKMEEAGFEFVAGSDINANEKDQPTEEDIVWRLPPSLVTSKEDPELMAKFKAVGESNRMTLRFRKP